MREKKVAFLGLGAMGARMASRLVQAGHDVVVYNRAPERTQPLVERGATRASSPRGAAAGRDIVISMVRDDHASRAVWLDPKTGALAAVGPGTVVIESSTLTLEWTRQLNRAAAERGVALLDAPVVGSRPQADAGQLIYLVGGAAEPLASVREVLLSLGGAVHHCGPSGAGMLMKLAVNTLFGIQVAGLGEVLGMTRRAGLADADAVELLGAMPVTSPALKGVGALMAAGSFAPMFPIDLVEKDFGCVVRTAADLGTAAPIAAAVRAIYARAKEQGFGDDNITSVVQLYS